MPATAKIRLHAKKFEGARDFISGTGKCERIAGTATYIGAVAAASYRDADAESTQ
jgi:hypothetical protein